MQPMTTLFHRPRASWLFSLALLAAALVGPAPSAAQVPAVENPLSEALPFDPAVQTGRLDNGLRYYIRKNAKPEKRAELWLVVNAGSLQEDEDQRGLAHFVEHMAFNGTENFAKQELVDYLESIGMEFGPDINAFTSFDETVYTLTVPTDEPAILDRAFQILEDWASGLSLVGEEIDKERGVVIEEWRLGRGAQARIQDKQFPVLFKDSRYAERLPIGEKEILEGAPHDAFRRFYADWYRPDLMAVIAVGDFDPSLILSRIQENFADLKSPDISRPREMYPVPDHSETLYAITTDPEATNTTISVYYKLEKQPYSTVGDYRRQLVGQLYHAMINARLDELRQQADPPFLFAFSTSAGLVRTRDVYLQAAAVQEDGVLPGLETLLTEVERVDRHGFTQSELDRIKSELVRRYEQAYVERDKQQSASYSGEYMRHFLEGEPSPGIETELGLVNMLLPSISLGELNHLADEWITESNRVIMVSGPEKSASLLPSEEQLAEVFKSVDKREIAPYADRVRDQPLVETDPMPGKVVATSSIEEIGVTEWQLANGAKVVLKPTDFKNDEILLTAFSPGGHSLVTDQEHSSASFATSALGEGGLGDFDQIELQKALAGKLASVAPYISELEEGLDGSASPQDLETMFQLLYLTVTAPRADEAAFQSLMTRMQTFIENRRARPESVFGDEVALARYQNHHRRRPPSVEILAEIDLATADRIYRDRFADVGDFTFILIGNFVPSEIQPLVERYIGSLPSSGRDETWRDVHADPIPGPLAIEVEAGLEPKAQVRLVWTGPAEWSRENQHDIASLAAALRIRLREVLREDLGGVYGVGVSGGIITKPKQRYTFSISFGCAPESVEKLIDATKQEIAAIQSEGIAASYTDKVREIQRRDREVDLQENAFWLRALKSYYSLGLDPRLILAHAELVDRVDPPRIQQTAKRYLGLDKIFQAVLYPEGWEQEEASPATP